MLNGFLPAQLMYVAIRIEVLLVQSKTEHISGLPVSQEEMNRVLCVTKLLSPIKHLFQKVNPFSKLYQEKCASCRAILNKSRDEEGILFA